MIVKVTLPDKTARYLNEKITTGDLLYRYVDRVNDNGHVIKLRINKKKLQKYLTESGAWSDEKVKADGTGDAGYLENKITAINGINYIVLFDSIRFYLDIEFDDLNNVTLSSVTPNQIIQKTASDFVNAFLSTTDMDDVNSTGHMLSYTSGAWEGITDFIDCVNEDPDMTAADTGAWNSLTTDATLYKENNTLVLESNDTGGTVDITPMIPVFPIGKSTKCRVRIQVLQNDGSLDLELEQEGGVVLHSTALSVGWYDYIVEGVGDIHTFTILFEGNTGDKAIIDSVEVTPLDDEASKTKTSLQIINTLQRNLLLDSSDLPLMKHREFKGIEDLQQFSARTSGGDDSEGYHLTLSKSGGSPTDYIFDVFNVKSHAFTTGTDVSVDLTVYLKPSYTDIAIGTTVDIDIDLQCFYDSTAIPQTTTHSLTIADQNKQSGTESFVIDTDGLLGVAVLITLDSPNDKYIGMWGYSVEYPIKRYREVL